MKKNFLWFVFLFALFINGHRAAAQSLAFTPTTFIVGNGPACVIAADVNGDGKPDLISANGSDNSVTVLTNNGGGIFGFNATYNVGNGPDFVVATDVNNDGKLDLVSANAADGTLTVLTNDGFGIFGSNATYNAGSELNVVAAIDINGDGEPDLVGANSYPNNTLTVLTNNGFGVFGSNATLNVGRNPAYLTAADINGDGKMDLICANYSDSTLTILTNNGSGVLGSNATVSVGLWPWCVAAADINNDGKVDLITANNLGGTLTVLTNNGSGIFSSNATLNLPSYGNVIARPICVIAADLGGNGKIDLISANEGGGIDGDSSLTVFTNNGNGVFGINTAIDVTGIPFFGAAADLNGDGKLDLITQNSVGNTLTVLTPTIESPPTLNIRSAGTNTVLSWTDLSINYVVQTNLDLTTTNWGITSYPLSTFISNNTNESVIIPAPSSGNLFFRLEQSGTGNSFNF